MADDNKKEATESNASDPLAGPADRLREAAKWLVIAFGAVATAAFAGLSLSNIGSLTFDTPDYRLAIAIVGVVLAFLGIAGALAKAIQLAGASTTSLEDLTRPATWRERSLTFTRREVVKDPLLSYWDGDIEQFVIDYRDAAEDYVDSANAYATDPGPIPDPRDVKKADYRLKVHQSIARRLLLTTGFLRLQRSFEVSRFIIGAWIFVAAIGLTAFAWAATTPDEPETVDVIQQPVAATVIVDEDIAASIEAVGPAGCAVPIDSSQDVTVLAVADNGQTAQAVAVIETCGAVRFDIPTSAIRVPLALPMTTTTTA